MATPAPPPGSPTAGPGPGESQGSPGPSSPELAEALPPSPPTFPPYPPYATEPAPQCVAESVVRGIDLRRTAKFLPSTPVKRPPLPARPRSTMVPAAQMTKRQAQLHNRCMRRHNAVLTSRLESMAKPTRRRIIDMWIEHAHHLPAETISRLRDMLDADIPFKPDQAYQYFVNLKKSKKKDSKSRKSQVKKDMQAICGDRRFTWARKATIQFARGLQRRLAKPGVYSLGGGMLRLSDIILDELCCYMNLRVPSRCCNYPKARFMIEMSDKIAIWIDEILSGAEDRMLMMDYDEDEDILHPMGRGGGDGFTDDFLDMMGGGAGGGKGNPAFLRFTGDDLHAFHILTSAMDKKGTNELIKHGKYRKAYAEASTELKQATSFDAIEYDRSLASDLKEKLKAASSPDTPQNLLTAMTNMIDRVSNYLAQLAEYNKDKGVTFERLIELMKEKSGAPLYQYGKAPAVTNGLAAKRLEEAKVLCSEYDDPALTVEIRRKLEKLVAEEIPPALKVEMAETLDLTSKYLSELAVDDKDKGPAFKLLTDSMHKKGPAALFQHGKGKFTHGEAAKELQSAKGLQTDHDDPSLTAQIHGNLVKLMENNTPENMKQDMAETLEKASKYLSQRGEDEKHKGPAFKLLTETLRKNPNDHLYEQGKTSRTNEPAAVELEAAKSLETDHHDDKLADRIDEKLTTLMSNKTPEHMKQDMTETIDVVSKYLSQRAVDENERGPTFHLLIDELKKHGEDTFTPQYPALGLKKDPAYALNAAHGLTVDKPDPQSAKEIKEQLHKAVGARTPAEMKKDMAETIELTGNYLSAFVREGGDPRAIAAGAPKNIGVQASAVGAAAAGVIGSDSSGPGGSGPVGSGPVGSGPGGSGPVGSGPGGSGPVGSGPGGSGSGGSGPGSTGPGGSGPGGSEPGGARGALGGGPGGAPGGLGPGGSAPGDSGHGAGGAGGAGGPGGAQSLTGGAGGVGGSGPGGQGAGGGGAGGSVGRAESPRGGAGGVDSGGVDSGGAGSVGSKGTRTPLSQEEMAREKVKALQVLHKALKSKGGEIMYEHPPTSLTYSGASDWLKKPQGKVDKSVRDSGDTARLSKKLERKLSNTVMKNTPADMKDVMQDVIIESSRTLAEGFVGKNYKEQAQQSLIAAMQKRGNEILTEVGRAAETYFFAAQRLKIAPKKEVKEPCHKVAYQLAKNLDEMVRTKTMPRKLANSVREHIVETADYLSTEVTKPDEFIEAYVSLLNEMEAGGDQPLIEGKIPKSYKEAAAYLRELTTFDDEIKKPDSNIKSNVTNKLKDLMSGVSSSGYSKGTMDKVINICATQLSSYIRRQGELTEVLMYIMKILFAAGDEIILRHGTVQKTCRDAGLLLEGKTTDLLNVSHMDLDPVPARKLQLKMTSMMEEHMLRMPAHMKPDLDGVIDLVTNYLAVNLLKTHRIQICKCNMKTTFVQCELWCDEILRHLGRPPCSCARHMSTAAMSHVDSKGRHNVRIGSDNSVYMPGLEVKVDMCPSDCPRDSPDEACPAYHKVTQSYMMYKTRLNLSPTRLPSSSSGSLLSPFSGNTSRNMSSFRNQMSDEKVFTIIDTDDSDIEYQVDRDLEIQVMNLEPQKKYMEFSASNSYGTPTDILELSKGHTSSSSKTYPFEPASSRSFDKPTSTFNVRTSKGSDQRSRNADKQPERGQPIISTDQMADWHALMVSLMWNVSAWRDWIQESIDQASTHCTDHPSAEADEWKLFCQRLAIETVRWQQYNVFSRQLSMRLDARYRDKRIVSPARGSVKTEDYNACQKDMLEIIDMFNRWTQWLSAVVKEANSLELPPESETYLDKLRWDYFKQKVDECSSDWIQYNRHLRVSWEEKYKTLIANWLPAWNKTSPVWVMSACGAVPTGAVVAGLYEGEVTWVARTTIKSLVLPASLHPRRHCCWVYADGIEHHCTKYQVMCNGNVSWVPWRASPVCSLAVRAAPGVYIGRVLYRGSHLVGAVQAPSYRCQVVIFERPFTFTCYELLVLISDENQP